MRFFKRAFILYIDGFKNLKLGKVLWKIIILKLIVIFVVLNIFIYDKSLSSVGDDKQKSNFVLENLIKKN
ncbi:DUF4492 domain-containing protein [Helicobacter sp. MIT 21-1697]|uniref:DUF4492 domain-containing protein n=1 Tax=Helicobacter sp. MIT 21-1697 TaxID=2993733 RepID=UPI00224ABEC0|nr:DUF4492 domain-containing protein [Helicobacter sp. MIT 21-1697]MCX2717700.1 DUF4492 domain-containing protein [Helicobacter sp. MIT 21-1697]